MNNLMIILVAVGLCHGGRVRRNEPTSPSTEASADTTPKVVEDECGRCPNVTTQHYKAKACTPIMDLAVDKCCPVRWHCSTEEERGVLLTQCFYQNKTYEVGAAVPVVGPCRRGCICKKSIDPEEPAKIECGIVECPSSYNPPSPVCRGIHHIDECCEVDLECNELISETEVVQSPNITLRDGDCFSEGLEYFLGDKVFFDAAPCQQCICSKDFSGPYGPSCTTMDCGMEYRDRVYLREGCTPLYLNGTCCPTDWICPESPSVIFDSERQATGEEDPKTHCSLGNVVGQKGDALHMYDCHINCQCITPPDFTCVQYESCPVAVAAKNALEAP